MLSICSVLKYCNTQIGQPYLAEGLAAAFRDQGIQTVIGPAMGGILVAHEVAKALGVRALFTERENGIMRLRRGFTLSPGERVLVVEDVITTGDPFARS